MILKTFRFPNVIHPHHQRVRVRLRNLTNTVKFTFACFENIYGYYTPVSNTDFQFYINCLW